MADKAMDNNQVTIVGTVDSEFTYSHEVFGEGFYMLEVVVNRLSHMQDRIPLMVSERLVDVKESYRGKIVEVHGQFRSYNKHEEAEANFIGTIASKVYYVPMYKQEIEVDSSIEIIKDIPVEIVGDSSVKKLILKNSEIETDGVFFLRDSISPGQLVPGL